MNQSLPQSPQTMISFADPITWGWIYYASEWLIRVAMVLIVPVRRTPAAAKGWLLLIFFFPWAGLILYFILGRNRWPQWRLDRYQRLREAFFPVLQRLGKSTNIFHPELSSELNMAVRLAENLGDHPILGGNGADILVDYDDSIRRLITDIDAARNHVHVLFYIFEDDAVGQSVVEALARAVARGVTCRALVDAIGSRSSLRTLTPKLTAAGVAIHELLPVGLFNRKSARFDLRNHRKIAIIDGRIGYTGSQNLVNAVYKPGIVYEELMVRVTGPVVLELQAVFVWDWFLETDEILDGELVFPDPVLTGAAAAQGLPSGPGFPTENNQRLIVALIHAARERVVITTPYFIPDEPLLQALQTAGLRGVEVHLVLSAIADQLLVTLAQRSYYDELLDAGVKIHLYRPKFLHAKHVTIDDQITLVGSSNMDLRSFSLNAEFSLLFYDRDVTARVHEQQERYFNNSDPLTAQKWDERSLPAKIGQNLARLLSPLL